MGMTVASCSKKRDLTTSEVIFERKQHMVALLAGQVSVQGLSGSVNLSYGSVDASEFRTYSEDLLAAPF